MKIFDVNGLEIVDPDLSLGYLTEDQVFVQHHEAVEAVAEQGHYEVVATYPNGGRDVEWIVDIPAVPAQEAWDEYEDIMRYVLYTAEELEELAKPSLEERIIKLESALEVVLSTLAKINTNEVIE